jgi:hypothetical protein
VPASTGRSDDTGRSFATLAVDLTSTLLALPEFYGFLLLDGGPDFLPTQVDVSGPYCEQDYTLFYVLKRQLVIDIAEARGLPYDASRGLLQIMPFDCSQRRASGVTVEVWRYDEVGVRPCGDDCKVWYPDSSGLPDVTLTDFTPSSQAFATARAAPGDIMIVMRDTKTRLPLSVLRPVSMRAGYIHQILIFPASTAELGDLPRDAQTAR